jgi:hypothetical protein
VSEIIDLQFRERLHGDPPRSDDHRDPYERDKARIIHSAAFRRLQGKTQVMGVGEGDFHRTRLTHSIEAGQIGEGLLTALRHHHYQDTNVLSWLPSNALIIAACYAHDLGHPPCGHAGERALQSRMFGFGGFEGNADATNSDQVGNVPAPSRHQSNPTDYAGCPQIPSSVLMIRAGQLQRKAAKVLLRFGEDGGRLGSGTFPVRRASETC